jgi:hypothetical protein
VRTFAVPSENNVPNGRDAAAISPLRARPTALIEGEISGADQNKADHRRNRDEVTLLNVHGDVPPPCRADFVALILRLSNGIFVMPTIWALSEVLSISSS